MELHGNSVAGATKQDSQPPDDRMREQMHKAMAEAADRVTFHRVELERWERLGRAAAGALSELEACAPVAAQAADDFFSGEADAQKDVSYR